MGNRIKTYQKVKELVLKGITSPSTILNSVIEVRNWRTAKKYIKYASEELSEDQDGAKVEYVSIISGLKYLKSNLLLKIYRCKNENCQIGAMKQILKINDQLIKLMDLERYGKTENKNIKFEVRIVEPCKSKPEESQKNESI